MQRSIGWFLYPFDMTSIFVSVCKYFLTFATTRWSRFNLYIFCLCPRITYYFFEEAWFLLMGKYIHCIDLDWNQDQWLRCAYCCRDVVTSRPTQLGGQYTLYMRYTSRWVCMLYRSRETTHFPPNFALDVGNYHSTCTPVCERFITSTMRLSEEGGVASKQT